MKPCQNIIVGTSKLAFRYEIGEIQQSAVDAVIKQVALSKANLEIETSDSYAFGDIERSLAPNKSIQFTTKAGFVSRKSWMSSSHVLNRTGILDKFHDQLPFAVERRFDEDYIKEALRCSVARSGRPPSNFLLHSPVLANIADLNLTELGARLRTPTGNPATNEEPMPVTNFGACVNTAWEALVAIVRNQAKVVQIQFPWHESSALKALLHVARMREVDIQMRAPLLSGRILKSLPTSRSKKESVTEVLSCAHIRAHELGARLVVGCTKAEHVRLLEALATGDHYLRRSKYDAILAKIRNLPVKAADVITPDDDIDDFLKYVSRVYNGTQRQPLVN